MRGYIYVCEAEGGFKFGYSASPWLRAYQISTNNVGGADLLGYVSGTRDQEREMHTLLKPFKIRGEWYRKCPAVAAVAALFPIGHRESVKTSRTKYDDDRREEAKNAVRQCLLPDEPLLAAFTRIAKETGLSERRVRALWGKSANRIRRSDLDALKSAFVALPVENGSAGRAAA